MLTDPKLRSQVDALWDKFWTGGLTNPLDAIEQFSYLLFLKRLDDRENAAERQAKRKGTAYQPQVPKEMRWSVWKQMKAEEMLKHLKTVVFPQMASLAKDDSSFGEYMRGAECKINKPSLLVEAVNLIDQMEISQQNQDVQGDLYEYLLSHLSIAGRNGQFRTPRHIIRMTSSPKRSEWDGADARPEAEGTHWRPGGWHGRISHQRASAHSGESHIAGHPGI